MKHKIFQKWLLSYLLILILPLIFSVMLYSSTLETVQNEVNKVHEQSLEQVVLQSDSVIDSLSVIADGLLGNDDIIKLARTGLSFKLSDYKFMSQTQKLLKNLSVSNNYIQNLFIYFPENDLVFDKGKTYFYSSIEHMSRVSLGINSENFYKIVNEESPRRLYLARDGEGQRLYYISSSKDRATVFIELDIYNFNNIFSYSGVSTYFTLDGENILNKSPLPSYLAELSPENSKGHYRDKENSSWVHYQKSETLPGLYIRVIPHELYSTSIRKINVIAAVYLLVCVVVGALTAFWLTRKNYRPVHEIFTLMKREGFRSGDEHTFQSIQNILEGLSRENKELFNRLDWQMIATRNNFMAKAIKGRQVSIDRIRAEFESVGIDLPHNNFMLISFNIEDGSNLFFEKHSGLDNEMIDIIFFVIANMANELLSEHYPCFVAEVDGLQISLSSIADDVCGCDAQKIHCEIASKIIGILEKNFGVEISASISGMKVGAGGIAECYEEIQEIMEYRNWQGDNRPVICYQETETGGEGMWKNADEAISHIRRKEYQKAIKILQGSGVCAPQKQKSISTSQLFSNVCRYISNNYKDRNFSINQVSEEFEISQSYLSQLFKKRMGIGALDFVHSLRVAKAKELLGSGKTVKEAADIVGYTDTRPLIRAFKRFENITPVEYKEQSGWAN